MRMPININNVPNEYIMRTKAGKLWRCGRGYRKNWNKLIGKLVLLHNKSYTLINRIKKNSKWYLVFTDGKYNYTEQQTKALHNKKLSRDVIKETDFSKGLFNRLPNGKIVLKDKFKKVEDTKVTKQTEQQLLLPAPMELVDKLVQEVQCIIRDFRHTYYTRHGKYPRIAQGPISNNFFQKCNFIFILDKMNKTGDSRYNLYKNELLHYYHPDRGNVEDDSYVQAILRAVHFVELDRKQNSFHPHWYV